MRRLHRFLTLSNSDRAFLVDCLVNLASIRIGLGTRGYGALSETLRQRLATTQATDSAARIIWGVRAVGRVLPGTKCLARAVTLHFLLARAGHASVIHIGVAKDSSKPFDAHAWVTYRGQIAVGEEGVTEGRYTPMTELQIKPS